MASQNDAVKIKKDIECFSKFLATNSDSSYMLIKRAYLNSLKLNNDSLLARTTYNLGYYHYLKNRVDSSKFYLSKSLEFSKRAHFKKIQLLSYNQQGAIATDENQFEKALRLYLIALDIADKYNLNQNRCGVLINLGNLYVRQKDTVKALEFYNQNIQNAEKYGLDKELIGGYMNAAILYAANNKNKALQYYDKAFSIAKKCKDSYAEYNISINLSELYLRFKNKGALKKVGYYLQNAQSIQKKLNDPTLLFFINFNYGGYYKAKGQYGNAIVYYKKAIESINKSTPSNQILNLYYTFSDVYRLTGDYRNALFFKEKQVQLSDSIFTLERDKAFSEIETRYEVDKKNLSIQILSLVKI